MKISKRTQIGILACCAAITLWDFGTTIYSFARIHKYTKEYVVNVPANTDPTDYYLSKSTSTYDSLYIEIFVKKEKEHRKAHSTLSNLLYVEQNHELLSFQAHCEAFLLYARNAADTTFVRQIMQMPFEHSTPKYYHEESQKRIASLNQYFNRE